MTLVTNGGLVVKNIDSLVGQMILCSGKVLFEGINAFLDLCGGEAFGIS